MALRTSRRYLYFQIVTLHLLLLLWLPGCDAFSQEAPDSDHDGLTDQQEQTLLERFRPKFLISKADCATRPARFKSGQIVPEPVIPDGTIYGQVTPVPNSPRVEVHYFTLWEKDCGRNGHTLDVEHVSTLVSIETPSVPTALYWYAGAHENTMCNISSGSRAFAIGAEDRGPKVWSSSGKHAMYFRRAMCGHGCGADSCEGDYFELANSNQVVNVGEPDSPMNGALWIKSPSWALSDKMNLDFPAETIARLDATSGETVLTLGGRSTFRGTIAVSDTVLGSAANGAQHTGDALNTADTHTSKSLGTATKATGRSLKRAWNAVFKPKKEEKSPDKKPQ